MQSTELNWRKIQVRSCVLLQIFVGVFAVIFGVFAVIFGV